jgi:hypothetical protein
LRGRRPPGGGYVQPEVFTAHISVSPETAARPSRLGEDMKHDPYYKYLAAVIIAGVLIALFDPAPTDAVPAATVATLAIRP